MIVEDYLPKHIVMSHDGCFIKYDEKYFIKNTTNNIYSNIPYSKFTLTSYMEKDFFHNKWFIIYESEFSHLSVPIYESRVNIQNSDNKILSDCIKSFNEKIGNVHDYVDTYRKRNLILKDLI